MSLHFLTSEDVLQLLQDHEFLSKLRQNTRRDSEPKFSEVTSDTLFALCPKGETLPGMNSDLEPGKLKCCIFKLDNETDLIDEDDPERLLIPLQNPDDSSYRDWVYNIYPDSILDWVIINDENRPNFFRVHRSKFGPLVAEKPDPDLQGTTTSTTTTGDPQNPCAGNCKWTWNDSQKYWSLDENNCSTTTTAAPTTTTAGPTTTTTECPCEPTTTTTSEPTTTTTTTTGEPCDCIPPPYCGDTDGECFIGGCSDAFNDMSHPTCDGTTTTAGSATGACCYGASSPYDCDNELTQSACEAKSNDVGWFSGLHCNEVNCDQATTTTCNCNTTTTGQFDCNNCCWEWLPSGSSWGWRLTKDECDSEISCFCSDPPGVDGNPCETQCLDCVVTPPTTTTFVPCTGKCVFWWIPSQGKWVKTEDNCTSHLLAPGCDCLPPSEDGDGCAPTEVLCFRPTTTPDANTSTTVDPCEECYTTTPSPTTTTTGTTTTEDPCEIGFCKWQWDGQGHWDILSIEECDVTCPCDAPGPSGDYECQVAFTPCGEPGTTTTQTTTTTTDPEGACCYSPGPSGDICTFVRKSVCLNSLNGVYIGDGVTCTPTLCGTTTTTTEDPGVGACCYRDNFGTDFLCVETIEILCDGLGGYWGGGGSDCDGFCGTTTTSAGCAINTSCLLTCINGQWQHLGDVCGINPGCECFIPPGDCIEGQAISSFCNEGTNTSSTPTFITTVGTCCGFPSGGCTEDMTEQLCLNYGGTWHASGGCSSNCGSNTTYAPTSTTPV